MKRLTKEEFIEKLTRLQPKLSSEIDVLYYKNAWNVYFEYKGFIHRMSAVVMYKGGRMGAASVLDKNRYFSERSNLIHNNKYNYDHVNYISNRIKVKIMCDKHGIFEQDPSNHLAGKGCRGCVSLATRHMSRRDSFIETTGGGTPLLYVLKLYNEDEEFYKVGITGKGMKIRLKTKFGPYKYSAIHYTIDTTKYPERAGVIFDLEQRILRSNKEFQYMPKHKFAGFTECFSINPTEHFKEFKHVIEEEESWLD